MFAIFVYFIEFELDWLLNVTCNAISVIYVIAHRCAGGLYFIQMKCYRRTCSKINVISYDILVKRQIIVNRRKRKGRDLTQPYDRSPYTDRKIQKAT